MGNLNASENVLNRFRTFVFGKYGKLHGTLREEVDAALIERIEKFSNENRG